MTETELKLIPCSKLFTHLSNDALLEGFTRYLASRIADQTQIIANLVMDDCEHRLGTILLQLAHRLGKKDPRSIRIEKRISHEELSAMVGTTRPRISEFMRRFRELGLIEKSAGRFLVVREEKLTDYLSQP
jgi:CRP-like cAMP-binding protein